MIKSDNNSGGARKSRRKSKSDVAGADAERR
jgi:hypothetical protein